VIGKITLAEPIFSLRSDEKNGKYINRFKVKPGTNTDEK
jgi:hypothetical protein